MSNDELSISEFFNDEKQLGAAYFFLTVIGIVSFCLIFFIGWLVLDYFWISLLIGITVILNIYKLILNITRAKIEYDAFVQEMREEAEEIGIDGDEAIEKFKVALGAIERAVKN